MYGHGNTTDCVMLLRIYIQLAKFTIFQLLVAANYTVATAVTDDLYMGKVLRRF